MKHPIVYMACMLCLSIPTLHAKVTLPSVLGDKMVLQQQTNVKLWGTSTHKGNVTIHPSWSNDSFLATIDKTGAWMVEITTPIGGLEKHSIMICDGDTLVLNNILLGEVWYCSGQSNMEMPMRGFARQPVENSSNIIAKAKPSTPIRIFNTDSDNGRWLRQSSKTPQSDIEGRWQENKPMAVANVSAVGYYFAQYIQEVLEVPVGIIVSSRGGSSIEAWMSREALSPFDYVDTSILDSDIEITPQMEVRTPCVLYNGRIAPLLNYTIKGFLWYQGESNRHNAEQYKKLTPAFVADLRQRWGYEFPFYFVEIAPYNYEGAEGTSAAILREAQLQNMIDIPNSGMVSTLDIGNATAIHPEKKRQVGERLAQLALAECYRIDMGYDCTTPYYSSMEVEDNKVYIHVKGVKYGLAPLWSELHGFEMAGEDNVFYPATGYIDTTTGILTVTCDKVENPFAVRYAYRNYPSAVSVFSISGIPLAPFRTDKPK